jgi:transposase
MGTIPLLPAVIKCARQAAKRTWETVSAATLSTLLELPEFKVTHMENEGEVLRLKCEHRETVALCPRCRELSTTLHQSDEEREVRDLSLWGKRVLLHFPVRRFQCAPCGRPFTERLPSIAPRRRQTRRYEQYVYERCLVSDRKAIAEQEHLSASTVKDIFIKWAKRATRRKQTRPMRVLGIDEIALKKRHKQYALVLSDLEKRCVIAILPNRKKETLIGWLKAWPEADREAIRTVSTDLWEPYRRAVQEALPQAQQVADRFHVMKQLNERLTQARRALQKQADETTRQALKGSRWILLKTRRDLTPVEETKLQTVLAASPELRTMYLLKEEFRTICDKARDREQAARFLRAWIGKVQFTRNKRLLKFVATLRNWWHEFLNYFIARVTQAFVEGINNAIRTIIRRAYGFRNFDHFRLQVLAQHGSM